MDCVWLFLCVTGTDDCLGRFVREMAQATTTAAGLEEEPICLRRIFSLKFAPCNVQGRSWDIILRGIFILDQI